MLSCITLNGSTLSYVVLSIFAILVISVECGSLPTLCPCSEALAVKVETPSTSLSDSSPKLGDHDRHSGSPRHGCSRNFVNKDVLSLRGASCIYGFLRGGNGEQDFSGGKDGGRIEMILGPMFAGKSTEMIRRIRRHRLANRTCVLIKYSKDQRHGEERDELSTHDNNRIHAIPTQVLFNAWDAVKDADVVGIDEGQFYDDLVPFCEQLAGRGCIVILAALDGTFLREPFGAVGALLPRAEYVTKLSAVCKLCRREASFTRRTTTETALEAIGGAEMYMPTCRKCFTAPITRQEEAGG